MKLLVIILFPVVASAQIITRTASLQLNDYVDLTTGNCFSAEDASENSQFVYDCLPIPPAKRDLFVNYYDHSLCICPCPSSAIGSERPYYRYDGEPDSINLNGPLNLENTSFFTKVDTIHDNRTGGDCELPYFVWDNSSDKIIMVMTTSDNRYALTVLTPTYKLVDCYSNTGDTTYHWTSSHLIGFSATWYIQMNGLPLFQGIDVPTGITSNPRRNYSTKVSHKAAYYSLLGQKVPLNLEQLRRGSLNHRMPSMFVVEKNGKTQLLLQ